MKASDYIRKIAGKNKQKLIRALKPERDPYVKDVDLDVISDGALKAGNQLRGEKRPPSLMVYGVTTRSGTNYVANLLAYHPDIEAWPNNVWEVPFLRHIGKIMDFEEGFFRNKNLSENMQEHDFLTIFGSAFMGYLHSFVPAEKTMLVKEPNVSFLPYFPVVFPNEHLLLILRDGRDVVYSTLKSWPQVDFSDVCQRWNDSARLILQFISKYKDNPAYMLIKYEDVVADPAKFIKTACDRYTLNVNTFPFKELDTMPVIGSSVASQKDGAVTWDHVEKPKDFNPVGRWQSWPEQQKNIFKKIAGETLQEAGYCMDSDW